MINKRGLQTTQPTRGGDVTTVWQTTVQIVSIPPAPSNWTRLTSWRGEAARQTSWMDDTAPHEMSRLIQVRHLSKSGFAIYATDKYTAESRYQ